MYATCHLATQRRNRHPLNRQSSTQTPELNPHDPLSQPDPAHQHGVHLQGRRRVPQGQHPRLRRHRAPGRPGGPGLVRFCFSLYVGGVDRWVGLILLSPFPPYLPTKSPYHITHQVQHPPDAGAQGLAAAGQGARHDAAADGGGRAPGNVGGAGLRGRQLRLPLLLLPGARDADGGHQRGEGQHPGACERAGGRLGGLGWRLSERRRPPDPTPRPSDHNKPKPRCTTSCCRARGDTPPSSSSARATCRRGWTRRSTTRRRRCGAPFFVCVENTVCGWWVVRRRHKAWLFTQ